MNDNLKKLIYTLRSGKYKQHIGHFRSPDGASFCFLGVACDVSGLGTWASIAFASGNVYWYEVVGVADGEFTSSYIAEHLGIPEEAIKTLVAMNDDGRSFEDLAKTLEVTFGGL